MGMFKKLGNALLPDKMQNAGGLSNKEIALQRKIFELERHDRIKELEERHKELWEQEKLRQRAALGFMPKSPRPEPARYVEEPNGINGKMVLRKVD